MSYTLFQKKKGTLLSVLFLGMIILVINIINNNNIDNNNISTIINEKKTILNNNNNIDIINNNNNKYIRKTSDNIKNNNNNNIKDINEDKYIIKKKITNTNKNDQINNNNNNNIEEDIMKDNKNIEENINPNDLNQENKKDINNKLENKNNINFKINENQLSFKATNKYSLKYGQPGQAYSWIKDKFVVEPGYITTITALNKLNDENTIKWIIDEDYNDFETTGDSIKYIFEKIGDHKIQMFELTSDNTIVQEYTENVVSRYVRREIRTLFEDDRNTFLDALKTLYDVSTPDGKELYGGDYNDIYYFVREHNTLAGASDCDHMHDGLGFLTQHAALTLKLERALQTIDSKITIPYWDFTIDAHDVLENDNDISVFYDSIIFHENWFGPAQNLNDGIVDSGRWAWTPILNDNSFSSVTNPFGYLRAPWNMNKIPYLTRYDTIYGFTMDHIPGCSEHYEMMSETSWYDFGMDIQYSAHGSIHSIIGGVDGSNLAKVLLKRANLPKVVAHYVGSEAFVYQKNMWRAGLLICPTSCKTNDDDMAENNCRCECPLLEYWLENDMASEILSKLPPVTTSTTTIEDGIFLNENGHDVSDTVLSALCNDDDLVDIPFIGDMLESSAPMDPIFWPMHPTLERLYMWWKSNAKDVDDSWPPDNSVSIYGFETGYCSGHNIDDLTPFTNLIAGDDDEMHYSNGQLYKLYDMDNDELPFIYDKFEWTHCAEEGIPADFLS